MANYSAHLLNVLGSAFKGCGTLATVTRRVMVYEIEFGQTGGLSSSDCQVQWDVSRFAATTTIAGASVAANLLDPADSIANASFLNSLTAEPTTITTAGLGLNLKQWGINQRGSYRWRALDDGDNIIIAGASSQGIEIRALSVSFASSAIGSVSFIER